MLSKRPLSIGVMTHAGLKITSEKNLSVRELKAGVSEAFGVLSKHFYRGINE